MPPLAGNPEPVAVAQEEPAPVAAPPVAAPAVEPVKEAPTPPSQPVPPVRTEPENVTPPPPPPSEPHKVTLNAGMLLPVRLVDGLSSERNAPGDAFLATLDKELVVDGFVIAERGARVEGRVVASDPGGKMKGVAGIAVELTRLHTSDGQSVAIQTDSFERHAEPARGDDAEKVVIGAVIGATVGGMAGGGKGAAIGAGAGDVMADPPKARHAPIGNAHQLPPASAPHPHRAPVTSVVPVLLPPARRGGRDYDSFIVEMRLFAALTIGFPIAAICLCGQGQNTPTPSTGAQIETKGMPPRATPADYQAHVQAGTVTIGAEFAGHSVPTLQGPLTTEDFVVVETGLFGSPDARLRISADDFSLRINGKKTPLSSRPYGMVLSSVKDPEWEPPEKAASKSKTSLDTGGGQGNSNEPPPVVHIPIEVQRAMAQRVQKATLPEGDRPLPQAGLVFFPYRGGAKGIHSVELTYDGPAGKVTLALQP